MKYIIAFLIMIAIGIAGLILFFGDCESIIKLIISKPIGMMLLTVSYLLFKSLKLEYLSTISNNN